MNSLLVLLILNELELICLHISIAIVSPQLNGFKFCFIIMIIRLNKIHLFAYNEVVSSIAHTKSFICIHLNGFKYCYVAQFVLTSVICLQVKWSKSSI